jgi:hypothetical protein
MTLGAKPSEVSDGQGLDPNLRALLDHIAVELAEEYVRLMEAAANAETAADNSDTVA